MASAFTSNPFHVNDFNLFGQTFGSSSTSLFGASTPSAQSSSSFPGFQGTTTFGLFGSTAPNSNQRRGSAIASYSKTTEVDPNNSSSTLKINSISAMPIYSDKSQEVLRFEDYKSGNKGSSFSKRNQGSAFQQFNSQFGPSTARVPSSQLFGSTPVSDFSAKSPFGDTVFGAPFGSGCSIGNSGSVDKARTNSIASSSIFGNSQFGPSTARVPSSQLFGSTPVSDFSAKSPFGDTVLGAPFGSGCSIGNNGSVDKARTNSIASSSIFGNSQFGPSTARVPSSQFVGSTPVSDFSAKSPFGDTVLGAPFGSGCSIGNSGSVDKARTNSIASSSIFGNSQFGPSTARVPSSQFFGSTPVSDFSAKSPFGDTVLGAPFGSGCSIGNSGSVDKARTNSIASSSIFGVPNVPTLGPGNGSSGFNTSIFGVPSTSIFEPSNGPGFGIRPTPSLSSTSASVRSTTSGPQSTLATVIGSNLFKTNPSSPQSQALAPQATPNSTCRSPFFPQSQAFSSHTTTTSTYQNPFLPQSQAFSPRTTKNSTYRNAFLPQSQAFSPLTTPNSTSLNPFPSQSQEFSSHATPKSTSLNTFSPQPQSFSSRSTPNGTSMNPLFPQSQAFSPHTTLVSSRPTVTPNVYTYSTVPLNVSMPANSCQCHAISTTFTNPSVSTPSSSRPLFTFPPSIQSTSVTGCGPWSSIPNAFSTTTNPSQPSQASCGLTTVTEVGGQNITGQQNASTTTVSMQPSLVVNPFPTRCSSDQPDAVTSIQHGISTLSVSSNSPSKTRTSLMRIRHVPLRQKRLPAQRHNHQNSNPKVPFFSDKEDRPCLGSPFLPRENPRTCFTNSFSGQKDASIQMEDSVNKKHNNDVLAVMPKLPGGEYYSEPSIQELIENERSKPGYISHVNNFVVGRQGYGSIRFLGDTDVRGLDVESIVQFKNREVIVYVDDIKKPLIGQSLNKPAEVTLLNVKCISKKTGKQYIDGSQVERYKEMLIKKGDEQGAEFVSYDPVRGEWKFRVPHF